MILRESQRFLGPVRIFREPDDDTIGIMGRDFSPQVFSQLRDQDKLELITTRRFLLETLEVGNLSEIPLIGKDKIRKERLRKKFVNNYCEMLGITGSLAEKKAVVDAGLHEANGVIGSLENSQTGILRRLRPSIGVLNEVEIVNDPMDLILMMFSNKASRRMRFEARRKLLLADLAIRLRMDNQGIERRLDQFSRFLGSRVWSGVGTAVTKPLEFISYHSPEDYSCTAINILGPEEKTDVSEFAQYHRFNMRTWVDSKGVERLAMLEHRGKPEVAQLIKLMRKDTKNIGSLDDIAGFKLTFMNKNDIRLFLEKLQSEADQIGTSIMYEEVYDTIDNGEDFRVTNPGSSKKLEIVKVHLRYRGELVELQLHTLRSYVDSRLHDEYGFEEYAIDRLFARGKFADSVIELLYPHDVYGDDIRRYHSELRADIRENKRVRSYYLPIERMKKEQTVIRYSETDLVTDVGRIISQLQEIPDVIVAIGQSGLTIARELSLYFRNARILIFDHRSDFGVDMEKMGRRNVLVVDDIARECKKFKAIREVVPNAKYAVLGIRHSKVSDALVDYYGRSLKDSEFLSFVWDRGMKEARGQVFTVGLVWRRINEGIQILFTVDKDGRYKLPGGRLEHKDRDVESGFAREFLEEVGLSLKKPTQLGDFSYQSKRNFVVPQGFVRFYAVELKRLPKFDPNRDYQVSSLVWVPLSEAVERLHTIEYKEPLQKAINKLLRTRG